MNLYLHSFVALFFRRMRLEDKKEMVVNYIYMSHSSMEGITEDRPYISYHDSLI